MFQLTCLLLELYMATAIFTRRTLTGSYISRVPIPIGMNAIFHSRHAGIHVYRTVLLIGGILSRMLTKMQPETQLDTFVAENVSFGIAQPLIATSVNRPQSRWSRSTTGMRLLLELLAD